jgi:hypothetical protein
VLNIHKDDFRKAGGDSWNDVNQHYLRVMKAKMQSNNFVRNGIRGSNIQHVAFCMEKKVGNWRSSALCAPPKKQKGCRLVCSATGAASCSASRRLSPGKSCEGD